MLYRRTLRSQALPLPAVSLSCLLFHLSLPRRHLFTHGLFPAWIPATSYCLTFYLLPPDPTSGPDGSGRHFSIQFETTFRFLRNLPFLSRGLEIFFHCLACHSSVSYLPFFPNFGSCLLFFLKLPTTRKSTKWLLYLLFCLSFLLCFT